LKNVLIFNFDMSLW